MNKARMIVIILLNVYNFLLPALTYPASPCMQIFSWLEFMSTYCMFLDPVNPRQNLCPQKTIIIIFFGLKRIHKSQTINKSMISIIMKPDNCVIEFYTFWYLFSVL